MKTLIILPIKNAYETILDQIVDLETNAHDVEYLVIDYGSDDWTRYLLLNNEINRIETPIKGDYLSAVALGIKYAYENKYDAIIQIDQSDSWDFKDIHYFIRTMEMQKIDMVLGSRFIDKKNRFKLKHMGARILRRSIWLSTRAKVTDPYLRFRMINRKAMKIIKDNLSWSLAPDSIAHLLKCGLKHKDIQITIKNKKIRQAHLTRLNYVGFVWLQMLSILLVQPFRRKRGKNG